MKKLLVLALALGLALAIAAPAFAGFQATMGLRINQYWAYNGQSKELNKSNEDLTMSVVGLVSNSYWRMTLVSDDKKAGGMVELGLAATPSLRFAYGWYAVGNCKVIAGWTGDYWYDYFPDGTKMAVEAGDGIGWGHPYHGRRPQIGIEWMSGDFSVYFAVENPTTQTWTGKTAVSTTSMDSYSTLPMLQLAARLKGSWGSVAPAVLWQQTQFEGQPKGYDDSITTWAAWLPFQLKFGGFAILANIHYIMNPQGVFSTYPSYTGAIAKASGKFEDTTNVGGVFQAGYTMGALTLFAGVGVENYSNDEWKKSLGYKEDSQTRILYYAGAAYKLHEYLTLWPEFNYYSNGDAPSTGKDAGNEWVLGLLFRFVF